MDQFVPALVVILIGIVTILGALLNWRIIMNPGKLIPRLLGPAVSRIVFVVAGVALIGLGVGLLLGWV